MPPRHRLSCIPAHSHLSASSLSPISASSKFNGGRPSALHPCQQHLPQPLQPPSVVNLDADGFGSG